MNLFDEMYAGTPPWDIGSPQPAIVTLADTERLRGSILDVGCGTGDNALFLAERGFEVWGVDSAERAVQKARVKAREHASRVTFQRADALELWALGRHFDTVIDCGLYHVLSDPERERYSLSLERVMHRGGTVHLLCFSELEPDWGGPRRVTADELRRTFRDVWFEESMVAVRIKNNLDPSGARAWLGSFTYVGVPFSIQ